MAIYKIFRKNKYGTHVIKLDDVGIILYQKYRWRIKKDYNTFYLLYDLDRKCLTFHRILLNLTDRSIFVDHINHDGLDNRIENLRLADSNTNQYNQKPQSRLKSSIYKGVWYNKKTSKYRSRITKNGVKIELGSFKTEIEAAMAYNDAATKLFGEFAYLNRIVVVKGNI